MCWQLDPTEGPSRVRRRMISVPRTISQQFFMSDSQTDSQTTRREEGGQRRTETDNVPDSDQDNSTHVHIVFMYMYLPQSLLHTA